MLLLLLLHNAKESQWYFVMENFAAANQMFVVMSAAPYYASLAL